MEDSSASHKCGRRTFTLHRIQGGQHELDVVDGVHQPVAVHIPVADSTLRTVPIQAGAHLTVLPQHRGGTDCDAIGRR